MWIFKRQKWAVLLIVVLLVLHSSSLVFALSSGSQDYLSSSDLYIPSDDDEDMTATSSDSITIENDLATISDATGSNLMISNSFLLSAMSEITVNINFYAYNDRGHTTMHPSTEVFFDRDCRVTIDKDVFLSGDWELFQETVLEAIEAKYGTPINRNVLKYTEDYFNDELCGWIGIFPSYRFLGMYAGHDGQFKLSESFENCFAVGDEENVYTTFVYAPFIDLEYKEIGKPASDLGKGSLPVLVSPDEWMDPEWSNVSLKAASTDITGYKFLGFSTVVDVVDQLSTGKPDIYKKNTIYALYEKPYLMKVIYIEKGNPAHVLDIKQKSIDSADWEALTYPALISEFYRETIEENTRIYSFAGWYADDKESLINEKPLPDENGQIVLYAYYSVKEEKDTTAESGTAAPTTAAPTGGGNSGGNSSSSTTAAPVQTTAAIPGVTPTSTIQPTQPAPSLPMERESSSTLVPGEAENSWIEFDENGVPLGKWTWDDSTETWIFEADVPLASYGMPKTADGLSFVNFILLIVCSFSGIVIFYIVRHRKERNRNI